jgi:serine/threonine protein kinase
MSDTTSGAFDGMDLGGGYTLVKRLGSGGFGEVWQAEAPGGIQCAVKIIFRPPDHGEGQTVLAALQVLKDLRHAFLLQPQAFWQLEDRLVIILELANGSLRSLLSECRQHGQDGIPLPQLLGYFANAAEALDYLHRHRVLHRGVKPDNLLIFNTHAKLAESLVTCVHEPTQRSTRAAASGTPLYMAPEVWRGKLSRHSDQYALATSYAELRLDRRLFASRDMANIMFEHLEGKPSLDPLPAAEQQVILKGLAKDPASRYPTCSAFVEALKGIQAR